MASGIYFSFRAFGDGKHAAWCAVGKCVAAYAVAVEAVESYACAEPDVSAVVAEDAVDKQIAQSVFGLQVAPFTACSRRGKR